MDLPEREVALRKLEELLESTVLAEAVFRCPVELLAYTEHLEHCRANRSSIGDAEYDMLDRLGGRLAELVGGTGSKQLQQKALVMLRDGQGELFLELLRFIAQHPPFTGVPVAEEEEQPAERMAC